MGKQVELNWCGALSSGWVTHLCRLPRPRPLDFLRFLCLFVFRWIYLNDQNLCIPASSSFVYGAVPIGASIYVIGDLDTGKHVTAILLERFLAIPRRVVVSPVLLLVVQVPITTTCVSLKEAQGRGTIPNRSSRPTSAAPAVQPYVLQIASFSACSSSKAYSVSVFIHPEEAAERRQSS